MSLRQQQVAVTSKAQADQKQAGQTPRGKQAQRTVAGLVAVVFGAAAVGFAFSTPEVKREAPRVGPVGSLELTLIAPEDLPDALQTVAPEQRAAIEDDILSCKRLAAMMTIAPMPKPVSDAPAAATGSTVGTASGLVQIKSGYYLSPPFMMGDYPVNVMVPMPELAPALTGQIEVIGTGQNVRVSMTPPLDLPVLKGNVVQNVYWFADQPCAVSG